MNGTPPSRRPWLAHAPTTEGEFRDALCAVLTAAVEHGVDVRGGRACGYGSGADWNVEIHRMASDR